MQIFGIGPLELLLILVVMILVLGPKGMIQAARESGKFIRKVVHSPIWREIVGASQEIRDLPNKIIKEAGIEAEMDELRRSTQSGLAPHSKPIVLNDNPDGIPVFEKPVRKLSARKKPITKKKKEKTSKLNGIKKEKPG